MISSISELATTWEEVASELPRSASDTKRLMAVVYYRFQIEGAETSDVSIIENEYFRRARWPRPSNLAATANYCASRGWLSVAGARDGRKQWRITRKGHNYAEGQLHGGRTHQN